MDGRRMKHRLQKKERERILDRNNGRASHQPDGREKEKNESYKQEERAHMHVPVHVKCVHLCSLARSSVCVHQTE